MFIMEKKSYTDLNDSDNIKYLNQKEYYQLEMDMLI